jgi:EAL domain-containing protein (putative c-di-GMP-specific phosphodiesterase class I)/ActR/RegA family two-component response regulator
MEQASVGRVLLVDDEPAILRAFSRALERAGFSVVTAGNGSEAGERLGHEGFDVVLTDISMPEGSGLDLLRLARRRNPDLPVILMTGNPTIDSATRAIGLGVLGYLRKPVPMAEMLSMVHWAVQIHRVATAKRQALTYFTNTSVDWQVDHAELDAQFATALGTAWMAYQPIVSLRDRRIIAHEALVRPTHPTFPHPGALIRAAEQLGRVHQLGRHLRDMVAARETPPEETPLLFVNLHGLDLGDDELLNEDAPLTRIAARVVLEITERASLDEVVDLEVRVQRLRELGYRIAIDDLGAGYSGLSLFAQLQPEIAKLDMALVRDIDRSPIKQRVVRSLINLCSEMAIEVVCEGVETVAERDTLLDLGADWLQGFLFARPGPAFPAVDFEGKALS